VRVYCRICAEANWDVHNILGEYRRWCGQLLWQQRQTWFHRWTAGLPYTLSQSEFTYRYLANSHGFRDEEWSKEKPDSVRRLFVVGDSFVEGDGVPYGEAVTDHLQYLLDSAATVNGCHWEVRNAGACGSDVFYARMLVEHLLGEFDHDAILLVINDSDLDDYLFRGGMERFKPDTTTRFRDGPWWGRVFRLSHLFRGVCGMVGIQGETLVTSQERSAFHETALSEIATVLSELAGHMCGKRSASYGCDPPIS
jgi:hypothetical protein